MKSKIQKVCYYCRKSEPKYKAIKGQLEIQVCYACLNKNAKLFDKSEVLKDE